ncbi:tripartite tricarboxylate transporter substrate binding protein [Variovorax sp. UMC13]|uniref:Bug family tripartite tricarboxylate transporter substrate binding protein n=1 Tax=Variovorax sp. UMC13 TaxID=1862326 RepID=UPI0016015FDE|nr:tripartite tricarboxylate transporter substrate-binding protein [Variovorax sp. UMC13]MBB1604602.1 hypothetical protein [Variovorax sp. UMC13]
MRRRLMLRVAAAGGLAASTATLPARAAGYPSRPLRIVVPWAAGTGTDLNARAIAQQITADSRQVVVVDNKAGVGGSIGTAEVARLPADGYTVLATSNAHVANLFLIKNLPYDPLQDFVPVGSTRRLPSLLVARPGLGVSTIAQLTELARREPGKISFGAGTSAGRMGMELYQQMAGVKLLHVPYKSATAALNDLLGGHCDVMFVDIFNSLTQIRAGTLVPLAASGRTRLKVLPELPTVAESGLPGYEMTSWSGLWLRKGAPEAAVAYLNRMARKAAEAERESVEATGGEVFVDTQEAFARFVDAEVALWRRTAAAAKIVPE